MKALPLTILLLAAPASALAQESDEPGHALGVVPRISFWRPSLGGDAEADEATGLGPIIDGNRLEFDGDLGLDPSSTSVLLEVAVLERNGRRFFERLTLSFLSAEFDGEEMPASSTVFNGRTFPAGNPLRSEWNYGSIGIDGAVYEDSFADEAPVAGSVLVGVRYTDVRLQLESGGEETDERVRLAWLGAGLRVESSLQRRVGLVAQGMIFFSGGTESDFWGFEVESWDGVLFEGHAGVRASMGRVAFEGGFRLVAQSVNVTVDDEKNFEETDFSFAMSGPYLSATVRF